MKGDFHVRFCERLAGEIPACLLDRNGGINPAENAIVSEKSQNLKKILRIEKKRIFASFCECVFVSFRKSKKYTKCAMRKMVINE